jgi:GTP-binding protein Era
MPEGGGGTKSGFVAVLGRPSAGKSTLVNTFCGGKVSIVSPIPQTTRNRIRGIVTRGSGQLVFLDTPGYHLSERRMNRKMQSVALETLEEADLVLYVVDSTRKPGEEEGAIAARIAASGIRTFVALNKIDCTRKDTPLPELRELILRTLPSAALLEVSALTGAGTEELLAALFAAAPVGEPFYDADYYTDQSPEFRVAEIVREKAIAATAQEIPHCLYVEIADLEMRSEPWEHLWARVFLVVERESQKGILVGRGGTRVKAIRVAAEQECSQIFPYPVRLDVRVKARPKWRTDESLLRRLVT